MELLLVRHGIAVERSPDTDDAARPLTRRGKRRFRREVVGLRAMGQTLDRVYSSPWTRAAQTARLLAPLGGKLETTALLTASPGDPLMALLADQDDGRLALVGHEPWMGELCALLVAGAVGLGDRFRFKKGGVAWLQGEPQAGRMTLTAFVPPRVLRRVRG